MSESQKVRGSVEFLWGSDSHLLLNIDPDERDAPHTFELTGERADSFGDALSEGARVEVTFVPVPYELVDPDSGPSESHRPEVLDVRVIS